MTDMEHWLAANDRYLASALAWLRERLERLGGEISGERMPPASPRPLAAARRRSLIERLLGNRETSVKLHSALPPSAGKADATWTIDNEPPALPAEMIEAETAEQPPALIWLSRRLGLSEFERHTLLLCVAMELDPRVAGLCARAQRDPNRSYPTFALALTLFDQPAWDVMSPERPLRYWSLLEINQPGAQPLVTSALRADERIVNHVKGLNYLDDRLAPLMAVVTGDSGPLPPSQTSLAEVLARRLQAAADGTRLPLFQLLGADTQSKLGIARQAASAIGLTLYRMAADALPLQAAELETFVRLWQRESSLLPIALYIDAAQLDRAGSPHVAAVRRVAQRVPGVLFLDTREPWPEPGRDTLGLEVAKPTAAEQQAAWRQALGPESESHAARLAGQFNFNFPTLRTIANETRTGTAAGDDSDEQLWLDCLRHSRPALDQLAQALEPKARWDELELPGTEKSLLRQIAEQVKTRQTVYDDWGFRERMNRGLGISVLFAGESGTGKTMAAEVIANELKLLLYRIDLSAVVSKYIGETEKNLRRLFDAAEDGGAILLFDEADALFGKRSEVRDSHDRYANIEINYLLQRMEAYRGLAILATNMKGALDTAFLRRLRFVVNFPFPGPAERMAIWCKVFPEKTQRAELDYERLARLNLTGGAIRNIALNAAFLAAHAGTPVTMPLILEAARTEFRKLEKPVNEADFRWLETARGSA
jgi:hypothetical protein